MFRKSGLLLWCALLGAGACADLQERETAAPRRSPRQAPPPPAARATPLAEDVYSRVFEDYYSDLQSGNVDGQALDSALLERLDTTEAGRTLAEVIAVLAAVQNGTPYRELRLPDVSGLRALDGLPYLSELPVVSGAPSSLQKAQLGSLRQRLEERPFEPTCEGSCTRQLLYYTVRKEARSTVYDALLEALLGNAGDFADECIITPVFTLKSCSFETWTTEAVKLVVSLQRGPLGVTVVAILGFLERLEDLEEDIENIGESWQSCQELMDTGTCNPCTEEYSTRCDDRCVDLATDRQNCGECGHACASAELCFDNECVGQNFDSDPNNCGAPGRVCAPQDSCVRGRCVPPAPPDAPCHPAIDCLTVQTSRPETGLCSGLLVVSATNNCGEAVRMSVRATCGSSYDSATHRIEAGDKWNCGNGNFYLGSCSDVITYKASLATDPGTCVAF